MATVTITGQAWDHNDQPVDASLQPELWFRPMEPGRRHGLQTHREVKAVLTASSGAFSVPLERDVDYVPVMRWLTDPSQANESMPNRARAYCEWPAFTAVTSGLIDVQPPAGGGATDLWWVSLDAPPPRFVGFWLVSDPSITPSHTGATLGDVRRVY